MIFVLPVLLYPLLGTAYFQMVQFQTRNSMTVLVVGGGQLASAPTPLIEGSGFSPQLFSDGPRGAELLKLEMAPEEQPSDGDTADDQAAEAGRLVQAKKFDAALVFPPDFAKRLEAYRKAIHDDAAAKQGADESGTRGMPKARRAGLHAAQLVPEREGSQGRNSPAQDHLHHGQRTIADGLQPADGGAGSLDGRSRQDEPRGRRHARPGGAALRGR